MSATPNDAIGYLTIAQTAEVLSCSADSVRRLIAKGELRAYRFGRLIRVAAADIARAGRPVSRVRKRHIVVALEDEASHSVVSGRRSGETWQEWARRREATS